jgi:hypothetical protein
MAQRSLGWLVGIAIPLIGGSLCLGAEPTAGEPDNYPPGGSSSKTSRTPESGRQITPSTDPRRKKLVGELFKKIGQLKPTDAPKKSLDDFFLIGTADLYVATMHADIRFEARQGQQSSAEYIVDYVLTAPDSMLRKWHIFSRHHADETAQQALAEIRMQFDQSMAYQDQLRQIYKARTMRRC